MKIKPAQRLHPDLFRDNLSPEAARRLFETFVKTVHIELFSYCNRRCSYCPVSLVDRISSNNHMDDAVFEQIIKDLRLIDYRGRISMNLYNEPLADPILFTRAAQIRAALPGCFLYFNSNGDYFDRDTIDRLREAGVNEVTVTIHPGATQKFDDLYVLTRFSEFSQRIGRKLTFTAARNRAYYKADVDSRDVTIRVMAINYADFGVNRGETVVAGASATRTSPCFRPFDDFTVYHDGSVLPCCQFFPDIEKHRSFISGTIRAGEPIFDLFGRRIMASFRRDLFCHGEKQSPCSSCGEGYFTESAAQIEGREAVYALLAAGAAVTVGSFSGADVSWRTEDDAP